MFFKMKNPTSTVIRKIKKVSKFPLSISPNPDFLMNRNKNLTIFQTGAKIFWIKIRGAKKIIIRKNAPVGPIIDPQATKPSQGGHKKMIWN